MRSSIYLILLSFLLNACTHNIVLEKTVDIDKGGWHQDSIVQIKFKPELNQNYDIYFLIRNDNDYPYSNLFLIAEIEDNKTKITDTLEYEMADFKGKWLGSGIWDLKESKLIYKTNFTFNDSLTKTFKLQQAARKSGEIIGEKRLKGINTVGIIIEKHK